MLSRKSTLRLLLPALFTACLTQPAQSGEVKIAPASSAALTPDTKTVIVAVPNNGALLYLSAETEKELRKVELDFKPSSMAVQGKNLFVSTQGSGTIHVLDVDTGKEKGEIKVPGEPVVNVACHSSKGLLYATNLSDEVYAVEPEIGKATKTKAVGKMVVVDPTDGKFVYTGIQKTIRDQLVLEESGEQIKVSVVSTNARASMLKYAVDGTALKLVALQDNAALNGKALALSADGKRIAMAGGGGWVSKTDGRFNYGVAVFETSDLKTMAGEVECGAYPYSISFHAVLNFGVVVRGGNDLFVFNGKSLARKESIKAPGGGPALVLYAAQGTKLVHLVNSGTDSIVSFHALTLSDQDKELLKAAYPKK